MRRWTQRAVPWIGGLFIAAIVALAVHDIFSSYRTTVADTGRDLDAQARILAEQTARSLQAVDVVLRHLAQQHRQGALDAMSPMALHAYLREQAVGLVQISGLVIVDSSGAPRALSEVHPVPAPARDVSPLSIFKRLSEGGDAGLYIDDALESLVDRLWIFPIARRLETPAGKFAGGVGARGRVDYFERFYRNVQLDPSTTISLMRDNGTLIARHPRVESALGQRFPLFDQIVALNNSGSPAPIRATSPIDGVERFASLKLVPDYPLAVIVTRDVAAALAGWRTRSIGTALRTLALSILAALLLCIVIRQLSRLRRAGESLEISQERYSVAVSGSDDGIFDWDYRTGKAFGSARGREILGLPPGPDMQTLDEWFAALERQFHPDDLPRRLEAIRAHLAGEIPAYEGDFRVRDGAGGWRWVRIRGMCVRKGSEKPHRMAGSIADIDAHKRAEDGLRASEEQYRAIFNGTANGLVLRDADTRVIDINPAFLLLTGYTREELVGKPWIFAVPEMKSVATQLHHRVVAGESIDFELKIRRKDGAVLDIEMRTVPIRYHGRPHALAMARDITAHKRAQEALRASEDQYRAIFNGAADALVLRNEDARVVDVNPAFLQLMGYSRDEIVGRDGWSFSGGLERTEFSREVHARVIAGESLHFELTSRRKDGTPIDLDIRAVPIRHLGRPHTLGMARDITAQKRAAAALRASEERYQLAVAGANQGLWDWDLEFDTMFISARAQEFMGLEPGEPLRPRREWIALSSYHPDDVDAVRAAMSDHLHGKTKFYAAEYRLRHPSGKWHWYRQRGVALRDANGRPYRMAGSMEDITAQKDLEGQLLQAKKLEAIGTLAGGIAHDFNNILAAILGYGEMAQKGAGAGTALRRHIDAVVSAGQRAKSLVERILAFSRSGIAERKPVHVQSVVAEALDLVAASLPKHVRLVRALVAGEAAVMGDATQIHQVVMNLCANGAQAMKSEGTLAVSLDVLEKPRSVAATSALPAGRYVRLIVRDTGHGIPAKLLERIFDPFFTTKDVGVGTGLGLSLVHGIVTDLGGGIEVDSRPGEGAAFTVYLPCSGERAAPAPVDETVPEGSGETVLIVDDEEALVRLGEEMVASLGYEPVGFASSAAALESFRASPERFHAVITDESMPELTGSDLVREIRRLRPDIPIVMTSGVVTPALSARARELGGIEVLAKPLAERELARSLAAVLHSRGEIHE